MTERPERIVVDEDVDERMARSEERLTALEREVELLREQVRSLSSVVGVADRGPG